MARRNTDVGKGRLEELDKRGMAEEKFFAMVQSPGVWDEREGLSELFCLLSISRNDNFATDRYHLLRIRYSQRISSLDAPPPPCSILTAVNRLIRWTKTIINELGGWLGIGDGGNLIAYFYERKRRLKK